MADIRESFATLEDGSGVGQVLRQIQEGESIASKNGSIAFGFKDSSGNAVAPQLDAAGNVKTVPGSPTCYAANGELAAGSASLADITNAEITVTAAINNSLKMDVSCSRRSLFQLVYVDDAAGTPAETVIGECMVGPGQYSYSFGADCFQHDASGGTGVQKYKVKGQNFNSLSSMRAGISAKLA